jgi:hypothetical protein
VIVITNDSSAITPLVIIVSRVGIGIAVRFGEVITPIGPIRWERFVPLRLHIIGSRKACHDVPLLPPAWLCVGNEG